MKFKAFLPILVALGLPMSAAMGQSKPAEGGVVKAEVAEAKSESARKLPYRGKVSTVDAAARTFGIKGKEKERVFLVSENTKITRDGAAAELSGIVVGDEVRGQATRSSDKWEAVSVMLGAKPNSAKAKKAEAQAPAEGAKK